MTYRPEIRKLPKRKQPVGLEYPEDIARIKRIWERLHQQGHPEFTGRNHFYRHLQGYFSETLQNVLLSDFRWNMIGALERSDYYLELTLISLTWQVDFNIDNALFENTWNMAKKAQTVT